MADNKSVAQTVKETVKNRLKEIRSQIGPLVKEEAELTVMAPGETIQFSEHTEESAPKAASAPRAKSVAAAPKRRKRSGGTRADQAVAFIEANPNASASDVAKAMDIKPNYLYRVLGDLEKEGKVVKEGRQYSVPTAA